MLSLLESGADVHAVAHITGGGLPGNMPRVLGPGVDAVFDRRSWEVPRIFAEVQAAGGVEDDEMLRVFNMGIGMVVAVAAGSSAEAASVLAAAGRPPVEVGRLEAGGGGVRYL